MNPLESLLADIKSLTADTEAATSTLAALVSRRDDILARASELGLKHRKVAPMLPAIRWKIELPAREAEQAPVSEGSAE